MAFSRRARSSRKTRRPKRRTRRRIPRSLGHLGKMKDIHHFKQTVNGGVISTHNATAGTLTSGGCIIRLTDLPFFQQMGPNFEFARLNKCRVEFWPKANMQINQLTNGSGALATGSINGTFITALDQVPFYTAVGIPYVNAPSWGNDGSNDTGVTSASFVQTGMSTDYIRGLQGSKEKELYKKHSISFYPAFYDYMMSGVGTGNITNVNNTLGVFDSNGCVERKIKKWVSINNIVGSTPSISVNVGPLYFGPVYALDANVPGTTDGVPLYDVRFTYSISFKRVRGV